MRNRRDKSKVFRTIGSTKPRARKSPTPAFGSVRDGDFAKQGGYDRLHAHDMKALDKQIAVDRSPINTGPKKQSMKQYTKEYQSRWAQNDRDRDQIVRRTEQSAMVYNDLSYRSGGTMQSFPSGGSKKMQSPRPRRTNRRKK